MRTDQPTDTAPDCCEQVPHLAVGPVTQQDERGRQIRMRSLDRPDPGQLGRFRLRWIVQVAPDDDQGRPSSQRCVAGERLDEAGHPFQLVQPSDGQHDGQAVSGARERRHPGEQVLQRSRPRASWFGWVGVTWIRNGRLSDGRQPLDGGGCVSDPGGVDPLRDDREGPRSRRDIDPHKLAQLVSQALTRKERDVVGLACQALHKVDAIPEVQGGVVGTERSSVEIARRLAVGDHGVGVGREAEHVGDPQHRGDVRSGEATDVRHPQMEHVRQAMDAEDALQTALCRDPSRPGVAESRTCLGLEWDRSEPDGAVGPPGSVKDIAHGAPADRDDLGDTRSDCERPAEFDQERCEATGVAHTRVEEFGIQDRAEVDLRDSHTVSVRRCGRDPARGTITHDVEEPQRAIRFREARRLSDPVVSAAETRDRAWHRHVQAIPERGDGCHADDVHLAFVGSDRCEIRQHSIIGNEPKCLDHGTPAVAMVRPGEAAAQSRGHHGWLGPGPPSQNRLRVHAGQAPCDEEVDQGRGEVGRRSSTRAGPGSMRRQRTAILSQHIQECVVRLGPRDGGQGMNGRDAGDAVGTVSGGRDQLADD